MSIHVYKTQGTCAKNIIIDLDDKTKKINNLKFVGGCQGNLSALSKVLVGKTAQEVITLFKGNTCGNKPTSCMDQLTKALEQY